LSAVELSLVAGLLGVREQEHVDEGDEQARGAEGALAEVDGPLGEDDHHQVPKDGTQEDQLRDELAEDVHRVRRPSWPSVPVIPEAEEDAEEHLHHPKHDGHLHLV
ncbi:unnamed protein product, partial [Ixodes pacificus]